MEASLCYSLLFLSYFTDTALGFEEKVNSLPVWTLNLEIRYFRMLGANSKLELIHKIRLRLSHTIQVIYLFSFIEYRTSSSIDFRDVYLKQNSSLFLNACKTSTFVISPQLEPCSITTCFSFRCLRKVTRVHHMRTVRMS